MPYIRVPTFTMPLAIYTVGTGIMLITKLESCQMFLLNHSVVCVVCEITQCNVNGPYPHHWVWSLSKGYPLVSHLNSVMFKYPLQFYPKFEDDN